MHSAEVKIRLWSHRVPAPLEDREVLAFQQLKTIAAKTNRDSIYCSALNVSCGGVVVSAVENAEHIRRPILN